MKNLQAKQGYWLSKVDSDGKHIFSQEVYVPDNADLSEWAEITTAEKISIETKELAELNAELGDEATPMTLELEQIDYEEEVINRIRQRYTINEELAILRQRDSKADEFAEYYNYCEQVKAAVKAEIGGDDEVQG